MERLYSGSRLSQIATRRLRGSCVSSPGPAQRAARSEPREASREKRAASRDLLISVTNICIVTTYGGQPHQEGKRGAAGAGAGRGSRPPRLRDRQADRGAIARGAQVSY